MGREERSILCSQLGRTDGNVGVSHRRPTSLECWQMLRYWPPGTGSRACTTLGQLEADTKASLKNWVERVFRFSGTGRKQLELVSHAYWPAASPQLRRNAIEAWHACITGSASALSFASIIRTSVGMVTSAPS